MVSGRGGMLLKVSPPVFAGAAAILFGISTPLLKILAGEVSPVFLVAFLYLGTSWGITLLGMVVRSLRKDREAVPDRHDVPWLLVAILSGGVIAPVLLVESLGITPAATVSLLLNFEAVATTVLAAALFREEIGKRIWSALAVITAASILLTWSPDPGAGLSIGAAGVLLACIFWGIDNNATRKIAGKDPFAIVVTKSFSAGIVALLLAFSFGESPPGIVPVLFALIVGVFCYGLSMVFFVRALRDLGAARTGIYFSSAPFIGAAISLVIFRQVPGLQIIIASGLLAAGVVLLATEEHSPIHHHFAVEHEHLHRHPDVHHVHDHPEPVSGDHRHVHRHEAVDYSHPHFPGSHHEREEE